MTQEHSIERNERPEPFRELYEHVGRLIARYGLPADEQTVDLVDGMGKRRRNVQETPHVTVPWEGEEIEVFLVRYRTGDGRYRRREFTLFWDQPAGFVNLVCLGSPSFLEDMEGRVHERSEKLPRIRQLFVELEASLERERKANA